MSSLLTVALFHEGSGWALPERYIEQIRKAAGAGDADGGAGSSDAGGTGLEVRRITSRTDLLSALPETKYLIGLPLTEEQFRPHAQHIEWVQLAHSSGDASDALMLAFEAGVRVTSGTAFRAPQVAEHAMALTLAMVRRIDDAIRAQGEHDWAADEIANRIGTLNGQTIGILSCDRLDDEIASRASCFGAKTIALRRLDGSTPTSVGEVFDVSEINEVIKRSDVLIIAMPRIASTRGMINGSKLALMKSSAILIDVSRSGVVGQEGLLRALRRRRIMGAGLDVFENEPLEKTSPLWTMANVIVSPHVCAASPDYWARATEFICENVRRAVSGTGFVDELRAEWYGAGALV